jgi:hypothetical protein
MSSSPSETVVRAKYEFLADSVLTSKVLIADAIAGRTLSTSSVLLSAIVQASAAMGWVGEGAEYEHEAERFVTAATAESKMVLLM